MTVSAKKYSPRQRGNALFLVLIAVALFAALSYAITKSDRGGGNSDRELAVIAASQVTQYAALIRMAVSRMTMTGTAANTIVFTSPSTGLATEVFDRTGGAAVLVEVPKNVGDATAWGFEPDTGAAGYYIKDVGTNTAAGREPLIYLDDISLAVCLQIQRGLDLTQSPVPVATVDIVWNAPAAAYDTAGSTIKGADLDSEPFSCMDNNGVYDYYHALVEQ